MSLLNLRSIFSSIGTALSLNSTSSTLIKQISNSLRIDGSQASDAATVTTPNDLRPDSRGFTQAVQNVNTSLAVVGTAEAALTELTSVAEKQRELADLATKTNLTHDQRLAIDAEGRKLVDEYNRIVSTTDVNGASLLGSDASGLKIDAGGGSVSVDLSSSLTRTIGTGTFNGQTTIATGNSPSSLAIADFNGDGKADIVVANSAGNSLSVSLSNGDGTFSTAVSYAVGSTPSSVSTGDVNGDGNIDLVTSNSGGGSSDTLSVLLGRGNGTFAPASNSNIAVSPTSVSLADINSDGNLDIIGTSASNTIGGAGEVTQVALPGGTQEINNISFAQQQAETTELTIGTTPATNEITNITVGAPGTYHAATDPNPGSQEITILSFNDVSSVSGSDVAETTTLQFSAASDIVGGTHGATESRTLFVDGAPTSGVAESTDITFNDGSSFTSGDYFTFSAPEGDFYVYFTVDGNSNAPVGLSGTGLEVSIDSTQTADDIVYAVGAVLNGANVSTNSYAGTGTLNIANFTSGAVADLAYSGTGFASSTVQQQGADATNGDFHASDVNEKYFTLEATGESFYVYYSVDGGAADPAPGGTGIVVNIGSSDSKNTVAQKTADALNAYNSGSSFTASVAGNAVTITNASEGAANDATIGNLGDGFSVVLDRDGAAGDNTSSYFTIASTDQDYYVYFNKDGLGSDPGLGGSGIEVAITASDTASQVATKVRSALIASGATFSVTNDGGGQLTVTNNSAGSVTDALGVGVVGISAQGSTQTASYNYAGGDYFTLDTIGGNYAFFFNVDGIGGDPALSGRTGVRIDISSGDSGSTVASKVLDAVTSRGTGPDGFYTIGISGPTLTVATNNKGDVGDVSFSSNSNGSGSVNSQGSDEVSGSDAYYDPRIQNQYFHFYTSSNAEYYVYYNVDGGGSDPAVSGTGIQVSVVSDDDAETVASSTAAAINNAGIGVSASATGNVLSIDSGSRVNSANATNGTLPGDFTFTETDGSEAHSSISASDYFTLQDHVGDNFTFYYVVDGIGDNPGNQGQNYAISINSTDTAADVAITTANRINSLGLNFDALVSSETISVSNTGYGAVDDAITSSSGISVAVTNDGSKIQNNSYFNINSASGDYFVYYNTGAPTVAEERTVTVGAAGVNTGAQAESTDIVFNDGSSFTSGDYFTFSAPEGDFYVYFTVDGNSNAPTGLSGTGLEVSISSSDDADSIVYAVGAVLNGANVSTNSYAGTGTLNIANFTGGDVTDLATNGTGFASSTVQQQGSAGNTEINQNLQSKYFTLEAPEGSYYVYYNVDGAGSDPTPGGTGIVVNVLSGDDANAVAQKTASALSAYSGGSIFSANATGGDVTILNVTGGAVGDGVVAPSSDLSLTVNTQGVDGSIPPTVEGRTGIQVVVSATDSNETIAAATATAINNVTGLTSSVTSGSTIQVTSDALGVGSITDVSSGAIVTNQQQGRDSTITSGQYFSLNSPNTSYYVYFNVDGAGGDPAISGKTGIEVAINSTDSQNDVATKLAAAIDANADFESSATNGVVTITNADSGTATDAADGNIGNEISISVTTQGEEGLPGHGISISFGNGDGTFQTATAVDRTGDATSVTAVDLNNDGQTDLISTDQGGNSIRVLYNKGSGTYASAVTYAIDGTPQNVAAGDFNHDGVTDLAVSSSGGGAGNAINILLGNGDGTFANAVTYGVENAPSSLVAQDFNGDGLTDLASGSSSGTNVNVLINQGNGTFSSASSVTVGSGPSSIVAGDFNGDGISDIASANSGSNNASVLIAKTESVTTTPYFDLTSVKAAKEAITSIDSSLSKISGQLGLVGIARGALSAAVGTLSTARANLQAAGGSIVDDQSATQKASNLRNSIKSQRSTAFNAQANQKSSVVLSLLKDF